MATASCLFLGCAVLGVAPAQPPPATAAGNPGLSPGKSESSIVFELIPKAFQRNPRLNMTVITEVTDRGRKLPRVSPQAPAYYTLQSSGYHALGEPTREKPIEAAAVEAVLRRALAHNGYEPATAGHPATLLIVYLWGADNLFDQDNPALSPEQWTNNILDRAALAGGEKFAAELAKAIQQSDAKSAANSSNLAGGLGAAQTVAQMNAMMDPVRLFTQRSTKNELLVDQASSDCYYVVASSYDFASIATHLKQLLWRTRMTVNSLGVSQSQSLPQLVASAAPYFGQDMAEAEVFTKRAVPDGKVEIGTPLVVDPSGRPAAPAKD